MITVGKETPVELEDEQGSPSYNYGLSTEYNSLLNAPWQLIAWDTRNGLNINETFEQKTTFLARLEEVKSYFETKVEGLLG